MHQQQTPSLLAADVARMGAQAAEAAVEHRDTNPAKAAAAQAAAARASSFLRRHGDDRLTTLERIKLVMPWVSPASLAELQKVHAEVAALLVVARDFDDVLRERGMRCECGEADCRTTRLDAVLAKAGA